MPRGDTQGWEPSALVRAAPDSAFQLNMFSVCERRPVDSPHSCAEMINAGGYKAEVVSITPKGEKQWRICDTMVCFTTPPGTTDEAGQKQQAVSAMLEALVFHGQSLEELYRSLESDIKAGDIGRHLLKQISGGSHPSRITGSSGPCKSACTPLYMPFQV